MKLINKISILAFITLFAYSCVQDDDYSVPQSVGLEENQKLVHKGSFRAFRGANRVNKSRRILWK